MEPRKATRVSSLIDSREISPDDISSESYASAPTTNTRRTLYTDKQRGAVSTVPQKRRLLDQDSIALKLRKPADANSPLSLSSGGNGSGRATTPVAAISDSEVEEYEIGNEEENERTNEDKVHYDANDGNDADQTNHSYHSDELAKSAINIAGDGEEEEGDEQMQDTHPKDAQEAYEASAQAQGTQDTPAHQARGEREPTTDDTLANSSPHPHTDPSLHRRVQELEERLSGYDNLFTQLHMLQTANKMKTIEENAHKHALTITDLKKVVKAVKKKVQHESDKAQLETSRVDGMRMDMDEMKTAQYGYSDDMDEFYGEYEDAIGALNGRVDEIERRLAVMGENVGVGVGDVDIEECDKDFEQTAQATEAMHGTPSIPDTVKARYPVLNATYPTPTRQDEQINQLLKDKEDLRKDKNIYRYLYWKQSPK